MVAVVSGNGLGLGNSSLSNLGSQGQVGSATEGKSGEQVYVNSATGNLIIQDRDDYIAALGLNLPIVRTYNSQAQLSDDFGGGWRLGVNERLINLTGTVNTAGSTITKVSGDETEIVYAYDATQGKYLSTSQSGAVDELVYTAGASPQWTFTDGASRAQEVYDSTGKLLRSLDISGNIRSYSYAGTLLTQITDASGQSITFDYTNNNLTDVKVLSGGLPQTLTHYGYDTQNRLTQVTVDLTPQDNSITDGKVYTTTYTYDGTSNRVAGITQTDGSSVSFTYQLVNGAYRVASYTESGKGTTKLDYSILSSGAAGQQNNPVSAAPGWSGATAFSTGNTWLQPPPTVSYDANGNGLVLWGSGTQLLVRRYDKASNTWGVSTVLSTASPQQATLSMDQSGDAIAAWVQSNGTTSTVCVSHYNSITRTWDPPKQLQSGTAGAGSLAAKIFDAAATVAWVQANHAYVAVATDGSAQTWSAPIQVDNGSGAAGTSPTNLSVAIDGNGQPRLVWTQSDGTYQRVYSNFAANSGSGWSVNAGTIKSLESVAANASAPKVVFDYPGDGLAVWLINGQLQASRFDVASGNWVLLGTVPGASASVTTYSVSMDDYTGDVVLAWMQGAGVTYASRYSGATHTFSAAATQVSTSAATNASGAGLSTSINGGNAIVAWLQQDVSGYDNIVAASRWNGSSWGATELLSHLTNAGGQMSAAVAVDTQGNMSAVWGQWSVTGGNLDLYTNRYTVSSPWSGGTVFSADNNWTATPPVVSYDANGNGLSLWSSGGQLLARHYDAASNTWSPAMVVANGSTQQATLSVDQSGDAIAAWVQSNGTMAAVYVSHYNSTTHTWDTPKQLQTGTVSVSGGIPLSAKMYAGAAVVAWVQGTHGYVSVSTDGLAQVWSAPAQMDNGNGSTAPTNLSVGLDGNSQPRLVWTQSDGTYQRVYSNVATYNGTSGWSATSAASPLESISANASSPKVVFAYNGDGLALWIVNGQLHASRFDMASGTWVLLGTVPGAAASVSSYSVSMDDYSGNVVLAWVQGSATYASRYSGTSHTFSATATQVSTSAASNAGAGLSTSINGANAVVAWLQADVSGYDNIVAASRWNGSSWGATEQLSHLSEAVGQMSTSVAVDGRGNVSTLWSQWNYTGSGGVDLYMDRYTANSPWNGGTVFATTPNWVPTPASISYDANGNGLTLWNSGTQLLARRYDKASNTWSAPMVVATGSTQQATLSVDQSGDAIAAWVQSNGTTQAMYVSHYNSTTRSWDTPRQLQTGSAAVLNVAAKMMDAVAVVAWTQGNHAYLSISADGQEQIWSAPIQMDNGNGTGATSPTNLSVGIDDSGQPRLVWTQSDGTYQRVYSNVATYSSTSGWGANLTTAAPLETISAQASYPKVLFDYSGDGLALWLVNGQLQASRFDVVSGTWVSLGTVPGAGASVTSYSVSMDDYTGNVVLAWMQGSGTAAVTYASRYSAASHTFSATATQVSTSAAYSAAGLSLSTSINGGNAVVAWLQQDVSGYDTIVEASRWNGSSWGAAEQLSHLTDAAGDLSASVAVDAQGNVSTLWSQWNYMGPGVQLYLDRYTASSPWSGGTLFSTGDSGTQTIPTVAYDAYGNGLALWNSGAQLLARHYDKASNTWGPEMVVATGSTQQATLSVDQSGDAIAAWVQSNGTLSALYVSHYNSNTHTWDAPKQLQTGTASVANYPIAAKLYAGQGAVSWVQGNHAYLSTSTDGLVQTWSAPVQMDNGNGSGGTTPTNLSVGIDGSGQPWLVWSQSDGTLQRIYSNVATSSAGGWSASTTTIQQLESVNVYAANPKVLFAYNGDGLALWTVNGQLQASRLAAGSTTWVALGTVPGASSGVMSYSASMDDYTGNVVLAWMQGTGAATATYASRYSGSSYTFSATATQVSTSTAYNYPGSLATSINGGNAVVSWLQQDASGYDNVVAASRWNGSSWGATEQLSHLTDAIGQQSTAVAVDGQGNISALWSGWNPVGSGLQLFMDSLSRGSAPTYSSASGADAYYLQTRITDPLGNTTTLIEDSKGRISDIRAQVPGQVLDTRYEYDDAGNVTRIIEDANNQQDITTFQYDGHGNLTFKRDADGNTTVRTYDSKNQILTETTYLASSVDPTGQPTLPVTTRYVYDTQERLRFIVTPEGRVTQYQYNGLGQIVTTFKYTGAEYAVAGLSQNTALTEGQLSTWAASQDLTKVERVDSAYDLRGQLTKTTAYVATDSTGIGIAQGASVTQYVYDQRGQLLQKIDPRGSTSTPNAANPSIPYSTTYTYDGLGRVTSATQWIAGGGTVTTTQYNDAGGQATTTYANGLVSVSVYDKAGNVLSVTNTGPGSQALGTTNNAYDADGRLRMTTDPSGDRQYFLYDSAGRKVADIDATGALTEYVYDDRGHVVETVAYSDLLSAATLATLVDASGNPTAVSLDTLKSTIGRGAGPNAASDRITRHVYDAAGFLIYDVDSAGAVTQHVYDGAGRVTDEIQYANRIYTPSSGPLQASDISIQLSSLDRHTRSLYDNDGNLVGTLDAAGYLTEYTYDGAGQLTSKTAYATPTNPAFRQGGTLAQLRPAADTTHDIVTRYLYDGEGRQVGVIDGENYLTENVYDVAGDITQTIRYASQVAYSPGATLPGLRPSSSGAHINNFQYDGQGRIFQETNYEGTVTSYVYDAVGNVLSTSITSSAVASAPADTRTTQERYDALGRVIAELTGEGSTHITAGMTQAQIDAVWNQYAVHYAYDLAGRRISSTDQNGSTTHYYYDADGRLTYTINAYGEVSESRYNALGELTDTIQHTARLAPSVLSTLTGGLANTTLSGQVAAIANSATDAHTVDTYTPAGYLASTTITAGSRTTYNYDAFGDVIWQSQSVDATRTLYESFSYDVRGLRTVTQLDPSTINQTLTNGYDAFGRLTSVQDGNQNISYTSYDRLGRVVTTKDPLQGVRVTGYDAFSRILSVSDVTGPGGTANSTSYHYDDTNRSVTVTTPEGVVVTTVHNGEGQTLSVTGGDPSARNTTAYQYDANGRLTGTSDSLGTLESRTYDAAGRLLTDTDARGTVTRFAYDPANRVFTRTVDSAAGGLALVTTYTYDGEGRVLHVVDPNGLITDTHYDQAGNVLSVVKTLSDRTLETDYTYDNVGHVLTVTEGVGSANPLRTQYVYDVLGRRTDQYEDATSMGGTLNLHTQYFYDGNGNLTRTIDPGSNSTWYVYDADNRLRYTVNALGDVTEQTYDANSRVIGVRRYANAVGTTGFGNVVTAVTVTASPGADQYTQTVYDRDGRAVYTLREAILDPAIGVQEIVTQKIYDGNNDVTTEIAYSKAIAAGTYSTPASVITALNAAGNIAGTAVAADHISWTAYDVRGQVAYTVDATGAVVGNTYDNAGTLTSRTAFATTYTGSAHDTASLTAWANGAANANIDRTTRYWYDSTGRVRFVLDAQGYLEETRYNDAARQKSDIRYVGVATISAAATTSNVATIAAQMPSTDSYGSQTETTTSQYDAVGRLISVTQLIGASSYTQTYDYDAVGNKTVYTNQNGDTWRYSYDGDHRMILEQSPSVYVTTVSGAGGSSLSASTAVFTPIYTKIQYDKLGNVQTRIEGYGSGQDRTTTYDYDALGRQIRVHFPAVNTYNGITADNLFAAGNNVTAPQTWQTNLYSEVQYDALGNEVVNRDVAGKYSYKTYDALGRVQYEVDSDNDVTFHGYDLFGNETQVTRYAQPMSTSGRTVGAPLTSATVKAALTPRGDDRTINKSYDALNRVKLVTQPPVTTYTAAASVLQAGNPVVYAPTTQNVYNAFGDLIERSTLLSTDGQTWARTCFYYDHDGRQVTQVDAAGYVTAQQFDALGNLTRHIEYATAVAGWNPGSTPPAVAPSVQSAIAGTMTSSIGYDRETDYAYDQLNRKITETLVSFQYDSASAGTGAGASDTKVVQNQVTSYQYDKVGNQTVVNASGAVTTTYYDALGRVVGKADVARDLGTGTLVSPYTSYDHDAFGNVVKQTEFATGLTSVNAGTLPAPPKIPGSDRVTYTQYDALDRAIAVQDPSGAVRNTAYDARGSVAKTWQIVVNPNDNTSDAIVNIYIYDDAGRQIEVDTPSTNLPGSVTGYVKVKSTYNAFGEVIDKSTSQYDANNNVVSAGANGDVYYDYDNDGRLWRSNSGDGVNKVYLYNLQGKATAVIKSQSLDLKGDGRFTDPQTTATWLLGSLMGQTMRAETVYDVLGRVKEQHNLTFDSNAVQDAITDPISFGMKSVQGVTKPVLYWNAPVAAGLTKVFQYRPHGSGGAWTSLTVTQINATTIGVDLTAIPGPTGNFDYQLSYTRTGDTTPFATATGSFNVSTTTTYGVSASVGITVQGIGATPSIQTNPASTTAPFTGLKWGAANGYQTAKLELLGPSGSAQTYIVNNTANTPYSVQFSTPQPPGTYTYYITESLNGAVTNISYGTFTVSPPVTTVQGFDEDPSWISVSQISASTSNVTKNVTFTWPDPSGIPTASFQYRPVGSSTWIPPTPVWWGASGGQFSSVINGLADGVYEFQLYDAIVVTVGGGGEHAVKGTDVGNFTISGNQVTLSNQTNSGVFVANTLTGAVSAPTVGNTHITWTGPSSADGSTLFGIFTYTPAGGSPTNITLNMASRSYALDLANLTPGTTYSYSIVYGFQNTGVVYASASGQFQVTAAGGINLLPQTGTTLAGGTASYLSGVTSSGSNLVWTQAPNTGDTVWVTLTDPITGNTYSGPGQTSDYVHYTYSLQGLPSASYRYRITYTRSGASSPYLLAPGGVTVDTSVSTTTPTVTAVSTLSGIGDGTNGRLQWSPAASAGDTVSFQYLPQGGSTWVALTAVASGSGYYVDLTGLAGTTIQYRISYSRPGFATPYLYATGTASITATTGTTGNTANTTAIPGVIAVPVLSQILDRWGDAISVTDAAQQTTRYSYNQRGQLTDTTQPSTQLVNTTGGVLSATTGTPQQHNYYDILGRLSGTNDGLNTNTVTYNAAGEVLTETHADGNSKTHIYDIFGNLLQTTDELGYRTRNSYDLDGNLTATAQEIERNAFTDANAANMPAISQIVVIRNFAYDSAGRRTSETSGEYDAGVAQTTRYWYDLQGNLIRRRDPRGDANNRNTTYQYDLAGHEVAETNQLGATQTWSYDFFGHLQAHTDMSGTTYKYTYADYDGLLTQQTSMVLDQSNLAHAAQNIQYTYDAAGNLTEINENSTAVVDHDGDTLQGMQRDTQYYYDGAGRRVREKVTVGGVLYQDTTTTYDALGRVAQLSDPRYRTSYSYDAQGNRTHVASYYYDQGGNATVQNLWYTYDSMNRVLVSQGVLNSDNTISRSATQGVLLDYDAKGQRKDATDYDYTFTLNTNAVNGLITYSYQMGTRTEHYYYDGLGRLTDITLDAAKKYPPGTGSVPYTIYLSSRHYDRASRLTMETDTILADGTAPATRVQTSTYDDDGLLVLQTTSLNGKDEFAVEYGDSTPYTTPINWVWAYLNHGTYNYTMPTGAPSWTIGYDVAGNLRGYTLIVYDMNATAADTVLYQSTDAFKLYAGDSYQNVQQYINSTGSGPNVPLSGTTSYTYDVDGDLVQYIDARQGSKDRFFVNNSAGQVIEEVQGQYDSQPGDPTASSKLISALNELIDGTANNDPAQHYFYANGQQIGSIENTGSGVNAHFDVNYTPISGSYPSATPPQVVVQDGDTLRTIAARLYGDANLWYVIAQENGLTDPDQVLTTGSVLTIPNRVESLANTSSSLKPYDPSQAIGDSTPTQPVPPPQSDSGCGGFGMVLVAIVAIVVSLYVGPEVTEALDGIEVGSDVTLGETALSGAADLVGAGVGAAVGSAVGQVAAMALGLQDEFSWQGVAEAALSAGILKGTGLGSVFNGAGVAGDLLQGALNGAVNQGVGIVLGLQKSFSWRDLAISAVENFAAQQVGSYVAQNSGITDPTLSRFVSGASAGASQVLVTMALGGRTTTGEVLADVFGNALGNSVVNTESSVLPSSRDPQQAFDNIDANTRAALDEVNTQVAMENDTQLTLQENATQIAAGNEAYFQQQESAGLNAQDLRILVRDNNAAISAGVNQYVQSGLVGVQAPQINYPGGIDQVTADEYAARAQLTQAAATAQAQQASLSAFNAQVSQTVDAIWAEPVDYHTPWEMRPTNPVDSFLMDHPAVNGALGFVTGIADIINTPRTLSEGLENLERDTYGFARGAITGEPYQAQNGIVRLYQNEGVGLGSVDLIKGTVESLPVISTIAAGDDPFAIGRSLPGAIGAVGALGVMASPLTAVAGEPAPFSPIVEGGGLAAHEGGPMNAHTLSRHVDMTVDDLRDRLNAEPRIPAASAFYDRATAESVISDALDANQAGIANWINGTGRSYTIPATGTDYIGQSIARGSTSPIDVTDSLIVLRRDPSMPMGYRIHTAYPTP